MDGRVVDKESAEEKEKRETSGHAEGCTVRWRKPSDMLSVAATRAGVLGEGTAKADAAAEGSRLQVLA